MKLTHSVTYAIGILMQIQQFPPGTGHVTAAEIARGCRFPPRFLYRVLRRLVDAGLLRGVSGPGGGYMLARAPSEITLLDIVSGIENAPAPSILQPVSARHRKAIEQINRISAESAEQFAAALDRIRLTDLDPAGATKAGGRRRATRKK